MKNPVFKANNLVCFTNTVPEGARRLCEPYVNHNVHKQQQQQILMLGKEILGQVKKPDLLT